MIVSIDNIGDFGAKVYLDGKPLKYCTYADDEKGEAVVHKRVDGDYVITNGAIEQITLNGNIRIVPPC